MSDDVANSYDEFSVGQPTWKMALVYPTQGNWSEEEYLSLDVGRQVEFDRGIVEVLDLPTKEHLLLARKLFVAMQAAVDSQDSGEVFFAPLPVRLWSQKYREPDLVYVKHGRSDEGDYPNGADLVIEVVSDSPSDRRRDMEVKVAEYLRAEISEYWIVDPMDKKVLVNRLVRSEYVCQEYTAGQIATSSILPGFTVDVQDLFHSST